LLNERLVIPSGSVSNRRIEVSYQTINPFTEKLAKTFPEHSDAEMKAILAQADETFRNDWSQLSLADRKAVLKEVVRLFRERREEYAQYITLEMGKLITQARGEVDISADILEYYADNAEAFLAPETLTVAGGEVVVENAPLGVIFCIEPWNYPYYQLARVAGPNLMVGNTVIVKHAPQRAAVRARFRAPVHRRRRAEGALFQRVPIQRTGSTGDCRSACPRSGADGQRAGWRSGCRRGGPGTQEEHNGTGWQ
jgi:acyl-CoA reductase-like NAD-dependent aldehyde dehydrogenase